MRPVDETSGGSGAKLREVAMAARRDESQKRNRNLVEAIAGHKMCLTKPNLPNKPKDSQDSLILEQQ